MCHLRSKTVGGWSQLAFRALILKLSTASIHRPFMSIPLKYALIMDRPRVWHSKTIITLLPVFLSDALGKGDQTYIHL